MKTMPKRIWVLLTAIVLVAGLLGMTAFAANTDPVDEPVCYDHGDVNSDGAITGDDAVYLLFASFGELFKDDYPLTQEGDLDGDGFVTGSDAVYLLFASFGDMFGNQYPLQGTIHAYYEPIWTWDTVAAAPTAVISLKCACGENHTITEGITVTAGTVVDPTCVASGSKEYTGSVTFDGNTYENTVIVPVPALGEDGHHLVGEPTCTEGVKCQNCDYSVEPLGHSYVDNGEKVEGCKHTKLYKCACGSETSGDVYYTHSYIAELVAEATCTKAGKKLLTCACGDTQEEVIPVNPAFHVWGEAVTENGVTTQTCACGETKTIVVMSDNGVSADALKDSEVQLDCGTSVALDENTAEQLDAEKSVVIKVEQVDKDQTGMSNEEKAQVGNNAVYDFSMQYSDGTPITSFNGEVTVSLPYTLQEGDDVNAIDVWFIADDGSVECVKGVYSNNYVTFKTNHFSYYTVTRLTPEQRCAVYGHTIVERSKEATCTEDGYHQIFCQRCGKEEKNDVKTMLGHDYQKDTALSVDATCIAPGKLATQCTNCGHKRIQEVKQLSHKWSLETVAPSCSSKGYDKRTCDLCGEVKINNEKEAIGHNYSQDSAVWSWNEDHSKATVTLTCSNDKNHTKELNAVISTKGGNSCVGGKVVYTATASFNKISYTDTATGEVEGFGHTPDSEWTGNNEQHYHTCTVCGEPVGAAVHEWERVISKAATCDKDGSANDTCVVCGMERTVVLPATGKHTYKNGVCTSCGRVEGACDHKDLTSVEIELEEYGVCGGYLKLKVCECGKIKQIDGLNLVCELVDDEEVIDEENGFIHYAASCATCGMEISLEQRRVVDRESCTGYWEIEYALAIGNKMIVETYEESEPTMHPITVHHDPVNLADFGLCEQILTNVTCYCGYRSSWDAEGVGCNFSFEDDGKTFRCTECGATGTIISDRRTDGCQTIDESVVVYYKNGKQVFTGTAREIMVTHHFEVDSYEMRGDTCSDGVDVSSICTECGKTETYIYDFCMPMLEKRVIDTSASNSCTPGIMIKSCPCGRETDWLYLYDDERTEHKWDYRFDEDTHNYIEFCTICGFSLTSEAEDVDPSKKDENCEILRNIVYTYSNGEEDGCFTWEDTEIATFHNSIYSFELMGDSCLDGVKVHRTCSDCDLNSTDVEYYHGMYAKKTMNLSQHGSCSGTITLYECACGEACEVYEEFDSCQMVPIAGDEGFEEWRCEICGIVRQVRWEVLNGDQPCAQVSCYEYSYLKDGEILDVFEFSRLEERHRFINELTLLDGAETCNDGFIVRYVCLECGKTGEYEDRGCSIYPVSREIISTQDMCGTMEIVIERCACGTYNDTGISWVNDVGCDFYSGREAYNEEYNAWQYFCTCGASRISFYQEKPYDGDPCMVERLSTQIYCAPNGDVIGEFSNRHIDESHNFLYQFELLGETCEDGWKCSVVCAGCGKTESINHTYYGCEPHFTSCELVYESDDICGPVFVYYRDCACGKYAEYVVNTVCNGDWNNGLFTCRTCGFQHRNLYRHERVPGTCLNNVTMKYTFMLDGQTVATIMKEYTVTEHEDVYELILLGETCEDGYRAIKKCAFCDYEYMWDDVFYGHERYCTEYYEAPEGSCGGAIFATSCACGQEKSVEDRFECNLSGSETYKKDENGIEHIIWIGDCENCDMTLESDRYYTPGADACHSIEHEIVKASFGDWEQTLTGSYTTTSHAMEAIKVELQQEGSQSCEDGVKITAVCTRCGETDTWYTYSHTTVINSSIDLSEYGSVCGAKLNFLTCACGESKHYSFSDDTECDIGSNWIPVWIDGALHDEFYTSMGWKYISSYAYEHYCAVTEPACGLRTRMARYWLNENCTAVEYETWQLGYNPETGTCQKEITIATGNRYAYHAYEEMPVVTGTEGGLSTVEYRYTCHDCGSYYFDKYYYADDSSNEVKHLREAVNTLNNGDNKRLTELYEYVIVCGYDGSNYSEISLNREERELADGGVSWYQNEYTYDLTHGCKYTRTYSSSDGEKYTSVFENEHRTTISTNVVKQSTCTQSGKTLTTEVCRLCGEVVYEEYNDFRPKDHSWYYDSERYTYACTMCGLENQNGTSGSIWLEDLSGEESYVVGYYCADEITFSPYVSLILYDAAEGENDEIVLDMVVVDYLTVENGGVRGLSFSKNATAIAADAALKAAGYTGRYAVRISCVPLDGYHTLDYAVTFDTLTAE